MSELKQELEKLQNRQLNTEIQKEPLMCAEERKIEEAYQLFYKINNVMPTHLIIQKTYYDLIMFYHKTDYNITFSCSHCCDLIIVDTGMMFTDFMFVHASNRNSNSPYPDIRW